jgi:hypothetical protein
MPASDLADSLSRPPGTPVAGWRRGGARQRNFLHPNQLQRLDRAAKASFFMAGWRAQFRGLGSGGRGCRGRTALPTFAGGIKVFTS